MQLHAHLPSFCKTCVNIIWSCYYMYLQNSNLIKLVFMILNESVWLIINHQHIQMVKLINTNVLFVVYVSRCWSVVEPFPALLLLLHSLEQEELERHSASEVSNQTCNHIGSLTSWREFCIAGGDTCNLVLPQISTLCSSLSTWQTQQGSPTKLPS